MRQFVVLGHEATTDPDFSLSDLAGGAGRMDLLCRCLGAALFLSHDIREDVRVHLVLDDSVTVRFDGGTLRYAAPDERNLASLIRKALSAATDAVGHQPVESTPGVTVTKRGFDAVIDDLAADGAVIGLHEDGLPITDLAPPSEPIFLLSDHQDLAPDEAELIEAVEEAQVSLGPRAIHADHAITIAHNFLDTEGYTRYD